MYVESVLVLCADARKFACARIHIADMSALNGLALSHASPVWQRDLMSLVQFLPNVVAVRFGGDLRG